MALDAANSPELIQETVHTMLIQPLQETSQFLAAGPRIIPTAGPVRLPKITSGAVPEWYGPNELIADDDVLFDEVTLMPSTMKSLKTMTKFSNELARQSVVALESALRERLVSDVAKAVDAHLFGATGDGITTPRGLFAYEGVQNLAVTADLTLDNLMDAQGLALGANSNLGTSKWVLTSAEFISLRKLKDTDGRYLLQPDPTQAGTYVLFGIPVIIKNGIAGSALVDFGQIAVATDVAPAVTVLDQTFGDFDQQAIRVVYRVDAAPLNPEAIVTLTVPAV
ncbi:phage major capsid protein [Arthrobacter sp. EH-1B-1]|uniref:Phage major capsid protein n=1 Tax=Arthrobacter vasquezii TaxID=2977629 RepID=A0ABT6D3N0_9MICC|nr:phage major capsid protein [Arthrobacter vasquezii]MDF9279419.1 phage major capsid protein [Arthrobacter vasquezii]